LYKIRINERWKYGAGKLGKGPHLSRKKHHIKPVWYKIKDRAGKLGGVQNG
jgi:hypothetical protein